MVGFELLAPETVDRAIAELHAGFPDVAVLAGGTDLLEDLEEGKVAARKVISLRRLPWRTLDWNGPSLVVGSTLPLRALELDSLVRERLPALHAAVRAVGSVALRHRATLGGNLGRAAPASDLVPVLLALDAEVELIGPGGSRTVPVDSFVRASRSTALERGELVRSVRIPEARPSAYLWQRVRPAHDISQISVAVAFSPTARRWSVAVGGVPPRPARLPEAERRLTGWPASPESVKDAVDHAVRGRVLVGDRRASDEHRRRLAGVLLARALAQAAAVPGVRP